MAPKILGLGPGTQPADSPVWGETNAVIIKRKARAAPSKRIAAPALFHRHSEYCQKSSVLFQRPGAGRAHKELSLRCRSFDAKTGNDE